MGARQVRPRDCQRQHVLQLVAVSVGAARLVEGGPGEQAAHDRLVQAPAIEQQVHGTVRRLHLDGAEHRVPVVVDAAQHLVEVGRAVALEQGLRAGDVGGIAQEEYDIRRRVRLEIDGGLQR